MLRLLEEEGVAEELSKPQVSPQELEEVQGDVLQGGFRRLLWELRRQSPWVQAGPGVPPQPRILEVQEATQHSAHY